MSVSDKKVGQLIDDAMARAAASSECCKQVFIAFRDLQTQRQIPGNSLDLDLAAAEHYLFSKHIVCSGKISPFQMRIVVIGYDAKKLLDKLNKDPDKEQVTINPVSPPDANVVLWGIRGVNDGSKEHDRCNKGAKPPLWASIEDVFGNKPKF